MNVREKSKIRDNYFKNNAKEIKVLLDKKAR